MSEIFDIVQQFFQAEGWSVSPLNGKTILECNFQGKNGRWVCYAHAREEQQQFLFYSICSATVPSDLRPTMAEYLERANWGLSIGNFEMDWEDGEIRYKTGIDVEGDRLTIALIRQVVFTNVLTMDHYLPGIMTVRYGHISPIEAIAQVERTG